MSCKHAPTPNPLPASDFGREEGAGGKGRVRRFFWYWLPPLAWMGLLFFLSAQPDLPHAPQPWFDTLIKKIGHALVFGILAWLYRRALCSRFRARSALRWASFGLAVVYALSDEYHQTFVPGRHGGLFDVAVDTVGVCGAMLLDWWLERRQALSQASVAR